MRNRKVISAGTRFGRLSVVSMVPPSSRRTYYICICDCGKELSRRADSLKSDSSCGCFQKELLSKNNLKHGGYTNKTENKLYMAWLGMYNRCYNSNNSQYKNYGARGIKVCKRWHKNNKNGYKNFKDDLGYPPSNAHSLDRINVDGNYCKSNCKWSTAEEQGRNKRNTIKLYYLGQTLSLKDWCDKYKVNYYTARYRLYKGLSAEEILK